MKTFTILAISAVAHAGVLVKKCPATTDANCNRFCSSVDPGAFLPFKTKCTHEFDEEQGDAIRCFTIDAFQFEVKNPVSGPAGNAASNTGKNTAADPAKSKPNSTAKVPAKNPVSGPAKNATTDEGKKTAADPATRRPSSPAKGPAKSPVSGPAKSPVSGPARNATSNTGKKTAADPATRIPSSPVKVPAEVPADAVCVPISPDQAPSEADANSSKEKEAQWPRINSKLMKDGHTTTTSQKKSPAPGPAAASDGVPELRQGTAASVGHSTCWDPTGKFC
ncbi:thymocyte nuclear protein 1 [Ophiocordyceps camponoti-floridani]|uniref:Thymocyte nuclear protein 1 n=1 Tax=Ophiocordyceps camponoti-floridani TaxID=2030778 RepID=A0A8H4Q719_9HYPO|nr:thymocyte nuclear protein 1 [Ophiocordyceps camponoti-floridani]